MDVDFAIDNFLGAEAFDDVTSFEVKGDRIPSRRHGLGLLFNSGEGSCKAVPLGLVLFAALGLG